MTHLRRARVAALVIVAVLAVAGGFAARSFNEGGSAHSKAALRNALATPGQVGEAGEASLTAVEQYWQTRLTYPTGRFNQNWVNAAARQLKRVKAGVPKGFYRPWRGRPGFASGRAKTQAAAALAAARPLGPQPQASSGCQPPCFTFGLVSGRVSAIAFDPAQTNIAYIAQDGGGIWKTTNCCTPATTWQVTTDKITGGHDGRRRRHRRPEQPQHGLCRHGGHQLRLVCLRQRRDTEEHRRRCDVAGACHGHVRSRLPALDRRHVPAVPGGYEDPGRPERQQQARGGDEDGRLLLLRRRRALERRLQDQQLLEPAAGHHRSHPAGHRVDDEGLRGGRRPRLRDDGPAEPGQERGERRLRSQLDARERVSRRVELDGTDQRMAGRHRERRGVQPADRGHDDNVRSDREQARPDRDGDRAEQPERDVRRGAGDRPATGVRRVCRFSARRRAGAASSASGAPPTEERPGPRSRATRPSASSRVRRLPARAVRTRRRCGTTWASPSIRTIRTPSSWTRSTSGSRRTGARHSPISAAGTTAG